MFTLFNRARMAWAVLQLVRKPEGNLDRVLDLVDGLTEAGGQERLLEAIPKTPLAAQALVEQPRLLPIHRDTLRALRPGTLGRAYVDFLDTQGFDPEDLPTTLARGERIDPAVWAIDHIRETHDLWHVLTGFGVDTAGEGGLQAFYLAQIRGPLALVLIAGIVLNGLWQPAEEVERRMDAIVRGWTMGRTARPLFGMKWAELWEQPLAEVQAALGIVARGTTRQDLAA